MTFTKTMKPFRVVFNVILFSNILTEVISGSFFNKKFNRNDIRNDISDYDVLIIGAGMAGISALAHLVKNNVSDVVLLEAENRIGGRVKPEYTKYGTLDMGAQWIHGPSLINSVFNLANKYHLVRKMKCDVFTPSTFIMKDGTLANQSLVAKIHGDIHHMIETTPAHVMWEEYLNKEFMELVHKYPEDWRPLANEVFNAYKIDQIFEIGVELDKAYQNDYYFTTGCDLDIYGSGYQMISSLAAESGKSRIKLNHEVLKIKGHGQGSLFVQTNHKGERQAFRAKHVIFTPSLGVLRAVADSMISPRLSQDKMTAAHRILFGGGVKIYLIYEEPFWKSGDFGATVLGLSDQDYLDGKVDWTKRPVTFLEVNDVNNTLLTFVFGDSALQAEKTSPYEVGRILTEKIRKFTEDPSIPYPDQVFKSNWISDPFFRGTYSSTGPETRIEDFETLARPEWNGRLLFAGEATIAKFHSTMHGARSSGLREAQRILDMIKDKRV